MTKGRSLSSLIALLGCLTLLSGGFDLLRSSDTLAEQLVSEQDLKAIEVVHKRNIGQLHGLHHEMRATLKQLSKGRNDLEAARQLAQQLQAVRQILDTVAATERGHPQWASSWSQRHARLVVLNQEMETLLAGQSGRDGHRPLDHLGKKLEEMKEILDIW